MCELGIAADNSQLKEKGRIPEMADWGKMLDLLAFRTFVE